MATQQQNVLRTWSKPASEFPARAIVWRWRLIFALSIGFQWQAALAHAVFAAPKTYRNPSIDLRIDMRPQVEAYVRLGERVYADAASAANRFDRSVVEFLDTPNQESLETARRAWIDARLPYRQSEIFRFNDSSIDAPPAPGVRAVSAGAAGVVSPAAS